jgi:carbonic anhydrase
VKQAKNEYKGKDKVELVETAINDNVKLVAGNIVKQSPVMKKLLGEEKVKIVAAKYDLDDGKVTLMESK